MPHLPPFALAVSVATLVAPALVAQASEPVDTRAVEFLRKEGLEKSQVMEHLSWICDVYGPRLSGSPNLRNAQDWAVKTLASWGLQNAHVEEWAPTYGRGWRCEHVCVEVVGDNPWPVLAYPKAWSPSVPGRVEADVLLVNGYDAERLKALDLSRTIVMVEDERPVSEPFDATARRFDAEDLLAKADGAPASRPGRGGQRGGAASRPASRFDVANLPPEFAEAGAQRRQAMLRVLADKKPLALLDRGPKGDYGTVFVQGASADIAAVRFGGGRRRGANADPAAAGTPPQRPAQPPPTARDVGVAVIPQLTLAVEHYNRLCRLLKKGLPVRMALELRTTYFEDQLTERNVVAEIPGTDPTLGTQVVMVGAHFDSWHTGTGCTDNGCGSACAMEAMRLLLELTKQTGKTPRRTIRVALWSGEEQGILGSAGYVKQHFGTAEEPKSEHALLSGYFNLDNGTGRVRGVYLQGNEAVAPIFRTWLRPFHDLSASTLTLDNTGGTDHLSFDAVGLPGFQFVQDPVSYDPKTHHSNMDVWDHAVAEDLRQAATIEAAFLWHTAQREEMLPRKAARPRERGGRRGGN